MRNDTSSAGRSVIRLELPVDVRVIRIARLVVGGLAATAGFDVEEIDDLRIAVDEGCGALFEMGDGSPVNLMFAVEGQQVEVAGHTSSDTPQFDSTRFRLSDQILSAACDGHSWGVDGGVAYFRLYKSR
jgi:hypothetical protein